MEFKVNNWILEKTHFKNGNNVYLVSAGYEDCVYDGIVELGDDSAIAIQLIFAKIKEQMLEPFLSPKNAHFNKRGIFLTWKYNITQCL